MGRAYRVAGLAVLAELASVSVGLETGVLLRGSWCAAIRDLAAAVGEGLICGSSRGAESKCCYDCEDVS